MAGLGGFGAESLFYGAYCVLFLISSDVLLFRRRIREKNWPMIFANSLLFSLCTAHYALEFHHFHTTLSTTGVKGYGNETSFLFGADILVGVTDFVGDMVLLYRCWLVWEEDYRVIILPFLTAIGGFASYMQALHLLLILSPSAPVAPKEIIPLATAGFILPLCTNIMITGLIVGRIWFKTREARESNVIADTARVTTRAISIVIESGMMYLSIQIIFVALFSLRHAAQGIVVPVAVQIYGIAPTLIIIRVALGVSYEQTSAGANTDSKITWASPRRHATTVTTTTGGGTNTTDDEHLAIDVESLRGRRHRVGAGEKHVKMNIVEDSSEKSTGGSSA